MITKKSNGWVGVDLDGTLAKYESWESYTHIGEPIMPMVNRVRKWLEQGIEVRIFTARVGPGHTKKELTAIVSAIENWCQEHIGEKLPVTCTKDFSMMCLYDDRCVQVEANTGRLIGDEKDGCVIEYGIVWKK